MARCLIIGCGCRGHFLARALIDQGHAVRGTTRVEQRLASIQAAGVDPFLGDPDRVATITAAFEHVSVACVLLGRASGGRDRIEALHATRLRMLLARMLDTTVHGVVYEVAGTVDPGVLRRGAQIVAETCAESHTSYALLDVDPGVPKVWLRAATGAVASVLGTAAPPLDSKEIKLDRNFANRRRRNG